MMNVFINHCWCQDSIWGFLYPCRVIVTIDRIPIGKTYYDKPTDDWTNLVTEYPFDRKDDLDCHLTTHGLKPEVIEWLKANVKDRQDGPYYEGKQGWAIGTDKYNSRNPLGFSIFFERTTDAMKFIKQWSSLKKPIDYFNYFKDLRRKLDFKTNTLKKFKRGDNDDD